MVVRWTRGLTFKSLCFVGDICLRNKKIISSIVPQVFLLVGNSSFPFLVQMGEWPPADYAATLFWPSFVHFQFGKENCTTNTLRLLSLLISHWGKTHVANRGGVVVNVKLLSWSVTNHSAAKHKEVALEPTLRTLWSSPLTTHPNEHIAIRLSVGH